LFVLLLNVFLCWGQSRGRGNAEHTYY